MRSWEKLIWLISPRWPTVLGLATGVILLVSVGFIPWIEVVFPAWVFAFSVDTLVASFRRADPLVLMPVYSEPAHDPSRLRRLGQLNERTNDD